MKRRSSTSPLILALGLAAFGLVTSADEGSPILAIYRAPVTEAELDRWLKQQGDSASKDRDLALNELILTRTMADEAVRLGLDLQPATQIELQVKDAALAQPLLKRHVHSNIHFSDEEVEAKYQAIKDTFTRPRRVRLRNLFKRYPPEADAEAKAAVRRQIEDLRRQLLDGADFATLAEAESDSQTRLQGGLIGNVRAGDLRPEVEAIALAMEAGQISEILPSAEGLTILYCEEILEKVVRSPEEMREISRQLLEKQAYQERWAQLEQDLLQAAAPTYHWPALDQDPSAKLVEYQGGTLSVAEARVLAAGARSPQKLSELPQDKIVATVENFLTRRMMLREISVRGLAERDLEHQRINQRRQILASKTLAHLIQQRLIPPTPEETEAYFNSRPWDFTRPLHYRLAVLALPLEEDIRPTYRLGERIVHQLASGDVSFEEAARRHSRHPTAEDGGDTGWISQRAISGRFGIDFMRALRKMQPGERSDLVESDGILWIFELRDQEAQRPMTFEEAKVKAENQLGTQRARELQAEVIENWLKQLGIELARDG